MFFNNETTIKSRLDGCFGSRAIPSNRDTRCREEKEKKNSRKTAVGVPVARQLKKNVEIINRTTIIRIRVQRVYNRTFEVQCSVREFKSSAQRNGTVYNEKSEVTETRSIKKKGKKKGSSDKKRKKKAKKGSRRTLFVYLKRMERKALLSQFGFFAKKIKEKNSKERKNSNREQKVWGNWQET